MFTQTWVRRAGALIAILTAVGLLAGGGVARAHASLLAVTPGNGEIVDVAPDEVVLTFSEAISISGGGARVLDPQADVVSGEPVVRNETITIPIGGAADLVEGTYTITYEIISADSHRISGASVFHVGAPSGDGEAVAVDVGPGTPLAISIGSFVFTALAASGALVAVGLLVVSIRTAASDDVVARWNAWTMRAAVLGAVAFLGALPFRIARLGGGLDSLRDNALLEESLRGPVGLSTAIGAVGLLAVAGAVERRAPSWVTLPLAVGSLAAFAAEGHSRGERQLAMWTFDIAHVAAAGVWVGGLIAIVVAIRHEGDEARMIATVRRFSNGALVAVAVVIAAGVAMAWIILPTFDELTSTGWGRALLVKSALVIVVVVLGAYNRVRLVPALVATARRLAKVTRVELVLLAAVIGVTAFLVTQSPVSTRAPVVAAPATPPLNETATLTDGYSAEITVSPGRVGPNSVEVILRDREDRVINPVAAPTLEIVQPNLDVGPFDIELTPVYIGQYEGTIDLGYPGEWEFEVRVRVTDFTSVAGDVIIAVPG